MSVCFENWIELLEQVERRPRFSFPFSFSLSSISLPKFVFAVSYVVHTSIMAPLLQKPIKVEHKCPPSWIEESPEIYLCQTACILICSALHFHKVQFLSYPLNDDLVGEMELREWWAFMGSRLRTRNFILSKEINMTREFPCTGILAFPDQKIHHFPFILRSHQSLASPLNISSLFFPR